MTIEDLKTIIEALLVAADQPLTIDKMLRAFTDWEKPDREQIDLALDALKNDYDYRAFELKETALGFCLQTKVKYAPWISRLLEEKPAKYSKALLETLAIIAYRQPVTRADIEELRGVAVNSAILKTLMERDWVRIAGHRDVPGKPAVYVTTKSFLDYFNLKSIDELPEIDSGD